MSEFDALCRHYGLTWVYRDGAGRMQEAPEDSRRAVLTALGHGNTAAALPERLRQTTSLALTAEQTKSWGPNPWVLRLENGEELQGEGPLPPLPVGYHTIWHNGWTVHLLAAPAHLPPPPRRWGVTLPLFALWQDQKAGLGSYEQLAQLAEGLAPQGAAFLGINPIHAGFPADPGNYSPYAPSHRRRLNTLHIDTARLSSTQECADPSRDPHSANNAANCADLSGSLPATGDLIDYARSIPAQRAALEDAYRAFQGDPDFEAWRGDGGVALERFTTYQALAEVHGAYWMAWPPEYQDPNSPQTARFAGERAQRLRFHAWCQWQAERQLSAAQQRAKSAGMEFGLYLDLAVGTHPSGAETWSDRGLFAQDISLGAPPDLLGPSGQRWGLAPMRPDVLRATGYQAFAETLRQQLRFCGLLRIDHILGLERSFWLPDGLPGLYVSMPRDELLAVLRIEASRAGAHVIGEDLGTIPDGLRGALSESGVMGCRVAMFERHWETTGDFLTPDEYEPAALASWGTHDLPTWLGWRAGRDLQWRDELGELPDAQSAKETRKQEVARLNSLIGGETLDHMHGFLAQSESRLVAVQGEDLCGAQEQTNLPGTVYEHPNWCRKLPLPISGLISAPSLAKTATIMRAAQRNS